MPVQLADVWSCGVTLYVMLVGAYPFEDPEDPRNFRKTINVHMFFPFILVDDRFMKRLLFLTLHILIQRIMAVQYKIPDYVHITQDCRHLLSRIFVANPAKVCKCYAAEQHFSVLFI